MTIKKWLSAQAWSSVDNISTPKHFTRAPLHIALTTIICKTRNQEDRQGYHLFRFSSGRHDP